MRARCPKCDVVFEVELRPSLIHVGPWRFIRCPACGKSSMMNNFVNDEVTWPPEEHEQKDQPVMDDELTEKRTEDKVGDAQQRRQG